MDLSQGTRVYGPVSRYKSLWTCLKVQESMDLSQGTLCNKITTTVSFVQIVTELLLLAPHAV
jgi:hypothetical protein